jgi:HEAT repeat protein
MLLEMEGRRLECAEVEMNIQNTHNAELDEKIEGLIAALHGSNGLERQQARLALVRIGRPVVPYLIEALHDGNEHARWEAAEALADIHDPTAAPDLVRCLKDEKMDVREAAARALTVLDRAALPSLLEALTVDFGSPRLRKGARHILSALQRVGHLHEEEIKVLQMMRGTFPNTEELPWQAEAALEALGRSVDEGVLPGEK